MVEWVEVLKIDKETGSGVAIKKKTTIFSINKEYEYLVESLKTFLENWQKVP